MKQTITFVTISLLLGLSQSAWTTTADVYSDNTGTAYAGSSDGLDDAEVEFGAIDMITWCQDSTDTTLSYTLRNYCTDALVGDKVILGSQKTWDQGVCQSKYLTNVEQDGGYECINKVSFFKDLVEVKGMTFTTDQQSDTIQSLGVDGFAPADFTETVVDTGDKNCLVGLSFNLNGNNQIINARVSLNAKQSCEESEEDEEIPKANSWVILLILGTLICLAGLMIHCGFGDQGRRRTRNWIKMKCMPCIKCYRRNFTEEGKKEAQEQELGQVGVTASDLTPPPQTASADGPETGGAAKNIEEMKPDDENKKLEDKKEALQVLEENLNKGE